MKDSKELYSVQLVIPVDIGGVRHISARYSDSTDSLTVPSETAFSHIHGQIYIDKLSSDHRIGIERAKCKSMRNPEILTPSDIGYIYSQHGPNDYTEPHGKVKGTVFNRMTYHGYFSRKAVTSDDMKENIIFIPADELSHKMEGMDDIANFYMPVDGRIYRINRGITKCFEEIMSKEPDLFRNST